MSNDDWLMKHVRIVADMGENFKDESPTIAYPPHTVLKAICVRYYADMFAKVALGDVAKGQGYDAAVYLDLFAGPGLVQVDGYRGLVAGSPIAATTAEHRFSLAAFVEIDKVKSAALEQRLSSFLPLGSYKVFPENANEKVGDVIDYVWSKGYKNPIVFAFIDPQGMEAKWATVQTLSERFPAIDFMINLTEGAARVAGRIEAGMEADRPIFYDCFGPNGPEILSRINRGERVDQAYAENVRNVLGRPVGESIAIRRKGNLVAYHLLCFTRERQSGPPPWAATTLRFLKSRVENADGERVAKLLEVVKNRQSTL